MGGKLSSMTQKGTFFIQLETATFLGIFSSEKLISGFYEQLLTWWQPYLLQFISWKGEFSYLFPSNLFFFFYFIFSNLDLYCHSKFIKQVHRHPKPDLQEQSRGNEKTCPVICWVLLFSSIGLLANTQFTKSWEIWIAADRTEDLQHNSRIQSLIASEQWERKS